MQHVQFRCLLNKKGKNMMTNMAFTHETPIMKIQVGPLSKGHQGWVVMNEQAVNAQRQRKIMPYLPRPP